MRRKLSLNSKVLAGLVEDQTFLETNEADLFFRWHKEIRLFSRKQCDLRLVKKVVAGKGVAERQN